MKTIMKDQESEQDINIETYPKKKKARRKNIEETNIITCLKKKTKAKKIPKKLP